MTDIIVLQGPTGTAHVVDIENFGEAWDLPTYETSPQLTELTDPTDEESIFSTSVDPRRQKVLEEISLGGINPVTVREHHRELRHEGRPAHPTKWHK